MIKILVMTMVGLGAVGCGGPGGGGAVDCTQFPNAPQCGGVPADTTNGSDGNNDTSGCTPQCGGRMCGADGCGGFCGVCGAGTTCVDGACIEGSCGAGGLSVSGIFGVAAGFEFDKATVAVEHKMDVDAFEDGCITSIRVELGRGFGCVLEVEAGEAVKPGGGYQVTRLSFSADSQCPGFPDDREGTYDVTTDMDVMLVVPGVREVPDENAPSSCLVTNLEVRLEGTLRDGSGRMLDITLSSLRMSGEMPSTGSVSASCPCDAAAACAGKACGDDGCGFSCGSCGADERCNNSGQCECVPDCAGLECGDNGCGGSCGGCGEGESCAGGRCEACHPSCGGRECGDNGCGGTCGSCFGNESCSDGQCMCQRNCNGRECGDDGCGGTCGSCGGGDACNNGQCSCEASCDGLQCGDDGCGGSCGSCGAEETCQGGFCSGGAGCGDAVCAPGEESTCPLDCFGGGCNGVCDLIDQLLCPSDCTEACGDGSCGGFETRDSCAQDCPAGCGDGQCGGNETGASCPYDCSTCGDGVCSALELQTCTTDCFGF